MTTKGLKQIETLALAGCCDSEIVRQTGFTHRVVQYWRKKLGIPIGGKCKINGKIYTVYDRRTTEFICEGTSAECAKRLGMKASSLQGGAETTMRSYAAGGFGKYEEGVGTLRASGGDYGGVRRLW